jgi:uncharacterized protein YhbP (UPF0306 family)
MSDMKDSSSLVDFKNCLDAGKLMYLATTDGSRLAMCSVWYAKSSDYSTLYFTSRDSRHHSGNIRMNGMVSGSVVTIQLEGLGQKTQGVFFTGTAVETSGEELAEAYRLYSSKWPQVREMFTADDVAAGTTPMRMYAVTVGEYVWIDEVNNNGEPRQVISLQDL